MNRLTQTLLIAAALVPAAAFAQTIVIDGGTVHTMKGDPFVGRVVIAGGRIVAVGPDAYDRLQLPIAEQVRETDAEAGVQRAAEGVAGRRAEVRLGDRLEPQSIVVVLADQFTACRQSELGIGQQPRHAHVIGDLSIGAGTLIFRLKPEVTSRRVACGLGQFFVASGVSRKAVAGARKQIEGL